MKYAATLLTTAILMTTPLAAQDAEADVGVPDPAEALAAAALEAAPVFDGHNDVPIQLRARFDNKINDFDFVDTTDTGATHPQGRVMHSDLTRLAEGKVGAQYWSVYVPTSITEPEAVQMTMEQIDVMKRLIARYPEQLEFTLTADQAESAMAQGKIASFLGMEGGHSIGSSLAVLRQMYDLGARYMTITHSKNTPWADSATDAPEHGGLTDFGKDLIREMNRIGMLVDLSHVSEKTMMDALDVAQAPVIFSHSGVRAVNGHARNVPDGVLARLPENGGLVMVVGLPGFLNEDARQWYAARQAEEAKQKALLQGQPALVSAAMEVWDEVNPEPPTPVSQMADHIGHNDVPIQLRARFDNKINDFDFVDTTDTGATHPQGRVMHSDLTRLAEGKVGAQYWSVYVPTSITEPEAVQMTMEQIDVMKRLIARYPEQLEFTLTADQAESAMAQGKIASFLGMEGGHSIGSSLAVLRQMYDLGARYMTITHSKNTPWADSATDAPEHGGLTDFGKDLIREMNRIGMLVDLSHVSEKTMMDALDVAQAPVIFSHSGVRAVNGHARNVPDGVLARLPENGGLVMVVGLPGFLNEDARQWYAARQAEEAKQKALLQGQPALVSAAMEVWDEVNPEPPTPVSQMADHIDHIRELIGVEYIGIGADFDGMPTGPVGMEDSAGYPVLFAELARRGYSQAELEMIASRNAMRVLRAAERYSSNVANMPPIETLIEPSE
ncbi:MAG: dipeptidase [Pseudomonadota bacterium]